jgi:glycosyltransferase involved in cell wall biosynthesis
VLVALDATYLVDPHPSGISVYSRELLNGLAREHPDDVYLHYYRLKQFRRAAAPAFKNVRRRLLLPALPARPPWSRPLVFHALNQRVDQRLGKHVVSTFHDLFVMAGEYSSPDFRERFTAQAKRAAAMSDLIIAVSEFTRQQVISLLGVDAGRVRVVPHGVHLPAEAPELAAREKTILCVGALQLRKNVTRLVQAFERLPAALRSEWTLVLAGSTAGYGAAEILRYIEESPVNRQIQLKGYVTAQELNQLYSRALVFAFPSLDEGFGIPVLEAMAHGVPVLTSNRSALPQVAGDAAVTVDAYDIEELTNGLARMMGDSGLRSTLRQRGLERAVLFPWSKAVAATYQIYGELAG